MEGTDYIHRQKHSDGVKVCLLYSQGVQRISSEMH